MMAAAPGIGIFSDIHGNRQAFATIIQIIKQRQELDWLCLGDVVGWFFRPVQCVLMLKELVDDGLVAGVVPGNHDLMALDLFPDDPDQFDRMLATAFSAGMLAQCPEAEAFLRSLEAHTIEGETWVAAHHAPFGLPSDNHAPTAQNYGSLAQELPAYLAQWTDDPREALLTGHGHIPSVYEIPSGLKAPTSDDVTLWKPHAEDTHFTVPLKHERRYWVRNGTVGGPYPDGVVVVNWAEYHPGECVILHREPYDTMELEADIQSRHHIMTHRDTWQRQRRILQQIAVQQ
jgi:hypothetical protein